MCCGCGRVRSATKLAVLAVTGCLIAGASARAAPYPVAVCNDAAGNSAAAWTVEATSASGQLETIASCPAGSPDPYGALRDGLGVTDVVNAWQEGPPDGTFSEWRFEAPSGTSIVGARVTREIGNRDEWTPYGRIDDVDQAGESCMRGMNQSFCRIQGTRAFSGLDARSIAYGIRCVTAPYCAHLWDLRAVWVLVLGATVTLDDRESPVVSGVEASGVADGRWWNRAGVVSFSASDNTGIRRRRVVVDGVTRGLVDAPGASAGGCGDLGVGVAYSYSRPCAGSRGLNGLRSVAVEPCTWGDGVHTIRGGATDTGGLDSVSSVAVPARVDCSAPLLSVEARDPEVVEGGPVEPVVSASDPVSGLASVAVEVSVDSGAWTPLPKPVVAEVGRSYVFRARAFDVAGNVTAWRESEAVVGVAAPVPVEDDTSEEAGGDVVPPVVVAEAAGEGTFAPPLEVLAEVAPPAEPVPVGPATATAEAEAEAGELDPRLRISRVLVKRRIVDLAGTAAAGLRTSGTVAVRVGGRTVRRTVAIAGSRWRGRVRIARRGRVTSVEIRSRAAAPFAAGATRWRAKDRPPLRRTG
jgi:hypothetical protein